MKITDVLPVDGAAGQMLVAALKRSDEHAWDTVIDLSREAGLARLTGARAHARLVDAGILVEGKGGWWVVNQNHPYLPLLRRIVEEVAGPPEPPYWQPSYLVDNPLIEAALATPNVGPSMLTVRATMEDLADITDDLLSLEPALQEIHALTHNERARDLIHQLMGRQIGWGSNGAGGVLMAGLRATSASPDSATAQTPIGIWRLALHDVVDETAAVDAMSAWLVDGAAAGARLRSLRDRTLGAVQHHLAQSPTITTASADDDTPIARRRVEDITRWLGEHEAELDQAREARLYHVGGMPHHEDLGGLGDQLCATLLRRQSERLHATAELMTQDPAYQAWIVTHPDEAVTIPPPEDLHSRYRSSRRGAPPALVGRRATGTVSGS